VKEPYAETYSYEQLEQLSLAQIKELRDLSGKRRKRARGPALVRQERGSALPLSYAQERLWFLDQLGLAGLAYNAPMALRLEGNLNVTALEQSFAELIRRHESLRTRFESIAGSPIQAVDFPRLFSLDVRDLSGLREEDRALQVQGLTNEEVQRPFELTVGPLFRVSLLKLTQQEHVLLLTMHHIVVDGWSLGVMNRELGALYTAYCQGQRSPLPDLPVQYADYAIWQRQWLQGEVLQEHLQYWKERLRGAPPQLQLSTDRPRPAMESFKGATLSFELPSMLSRALKELAQREGATLFMISLAAYQVLLSRWSGEHDIVVGSPIAGRANRELEGLIGFFVNTLALRSDLSGNPTFRQLLERVKEGTLGAYAHQDLPFEVLVKELRPDRNLSRQPIFQVALVLQNYPEERLELPGLTWTLADTASVTTHFDLTLYLYEASNKLSGCFDYATDLFDAGTIGRMAGHLRALLEGIVANPDCPINQLPMLSEAEEEQLLVDWNATAAPYPYERCVHDLFAEQVERTPEATALVFGDTLVSYAELNSRANQLARYLRNQGVCPDQVVGVCVERSVEMVVSLLGILKAGGAYVPLDPNYPVERLRYMLEDAAPQVILTQEKLRAALPATQAEVITVDEKLQSIAGYGKENIAVAGLGLTAKNLVYVIYTSGSTGHPKGTAMTHGSMVNLIEWHRKSLGSCEGQRALQFAALSFDVAFQEIFSTLCTGGTLVLMDEWVRRDPYALTEFVSNRLIGRLFVPPLVLQSLAECFKAASAAPPMILQDIITAGEQLRISPEISSFFKRLNGCRLHNHYGPTETHVVTALTMTGDPDEWPALPAIGRPISNTQIYVLDSTQQIVPIGVVGEIYIGGAGVARGYHGRPELTEQRFVDDPFSGSSGAKLYRTGDVGRWRADGTLEYLGRNDDQVKIRGYRVELGEIEAQLARHKQVKEAAVIAREDSPGEKRLVAYVTQRDRGGRGVEDMRAHLKAALPEHMVPSAFVILENFPLTPNGKLDRRALPAPDLGGYITRQYDPPQGQAEEALADIWRELLQLDHVGRRDNFFELGGHSLHAMKLIASVAEHLTVRLSAIAVFQHPTIKEMATVVEDLRRAAGETSDTDGLEFDEGVI
jgi:amino acid adenylation domain-containing protein